METNEKGLLRAADSGQTIEIEICYRDGEGRLQSLVASGWPGPHRKTTYCEGHFIAHGVCVDCSRQLGKPVFAS